MKKKNNHNPKTLKKKAQNEQWSILDYTRNAMLPPCNRSGEEPENPYNIQVIINSTNSKHYTIQSIKSLI
jgi:hypothetical protein